MQQSLSKRRWRGFLPMPVVAAVAALGLAACGASDAGSHSTTSSRVTTSTAGTTTTSRPRATTTTTTKPATTTSTTTVPSTSAPTTTVPMTAPTTTDAPPGFTTTSTPPGSPPPPLVQPTAAHPLTILEVGDSLGIDLGWGLGALFGQDPLVHVIQDGVGDTGLARPDYYDWPAHLSQELAEYHPGAVVVMLGGNDAQEFVDAGQYVTFGTSLWHTVYSERVDNFMNEAMAAGAHVFWVGMPVMGSPGFSSEMALENEVYSQQAALRAGGVAYFSSWGVFTNSAGQYAQYLEDSSGQLVMVRDSDGVHLTYAGAERLANAMATPMAQAFGVRLFD